MITLCLVVCLCNSTYINIKWCPSSDWNEIGHVDLANEAIGIVVTKQHLVEAIISGMSEFHIRSDLLWLTPETLPQHIQILNYYELICMNDADH